MLCFFRFYPPPLGSAHPLHLHFSLLKVLMLYYWCFPFSFNTTTHAHTPLLICKALNKELLRANFTLFDCMMQQRLPGIIVKYCCIVFFCLSDPLSNSKNQGFFLEAKLVRFLSCKSCFWGHAGLSFLLYPSSAQWASTERASDLCDVRRGSDHMGRASTADTTRCAERLPGCVLVPLPRWRWVLWGPGPVANAE